MGSARSQTDRLSALDSATLNAIVEQAPDAILVVSADGSIVFANLTAEELFGFSRERLIGSPIELLVPDRMRDRHERDRMAYGERPAVRSMGAVDLELRARRADGSEIDVDVSLAPVESAAGPLVVTAIRDATARRGAEQDRMDLMNSVERQLERNRVAADIHDDLVQSLYAIGLGLLQSGRDDGVTKEVALERASSEVSEAIAELRAYVHWLRTVDSGSAGGPLVSRLRALIHGAPEGLEWRSDFDVAERELTAEQVRQAYLVAKELISNVHRHAGAREATISVTDVDGAVELRVADNGRGFEPERVASGSFGLDGIRRRVETLSGAVQIVSSTGGGVDVQVRIPTP